MRRAASQPPELPGYDYVKVLGSGGFSDVFLYDQRLPRRKVAVKVLLTEELNAATRAQFVAEANLMAQLSAHPYIVTIYHADVASDARPYFVMEYCSGPSLADRYKRETFSVEDALRTGVRLSSAIATAHAAGILHRDIKPANVLTNAFGWPALTDFGISSTLEEELPVHTTTAEQIREQAADTGTGSGQSVGMSVPWSPPEMFEDEPQPDVRSDVFSLAATIHTLLAGRTPFEVVGRSNGTLDLIGRIERGVITPIGREDIPRSLVAVLQKGMATRRTDRFSSAVDFARALQRVELELGYTPTSIEVPNLVVTPEARPEGGEDADETRVRSVSTIAVQKPGNTDKPERPVARAAATPVPESPQESTRLRTPVSVEQTVMRPRRAPAEAEVLPAEHAPVTDAAHGTRRLGILIACIVAVLLVAGGVTAAVLLPTLGGDPKQTTGPDPVQGGGGGLDISTIPSPKKGTATPSADGKSVTFVWTNPKPQKDDKYLWAAAETPDNKNLVVEPKAVVTGVVPGSRVCINIVVLRDGQTSPNPLKVCDK